MSIAVYGARVLEEAAGLARRIVRQESTRLRWATVVSVDPLRVRYDGEDSAGVVSPQVLVPCSVGDRVAVAKYQGQATVLGAAGGVGPRRLTSQDLDGVVDDGHYVQPYSAEATGARHYPFNRAGWLEVVNGARLSDGALVFQTYQEHGGSGISPRRAWRGRYAGAWSAWRVVGQNQVTASGGDVFTASGSGWRLELAEAVENAGTAHVHLQVKRTGGHFEAAPGGNVPDDYIGKFAERYRSSMGRDFEVLLTLSGVQSWVGRVRGNGYLDLTNATGGGFSLSSGATLRTQFSIPIQY